jgi:hypothetical protein
MGVIHLSPAPCASAVCCSSSSEYCCDVPPGSCWLSTASAPIDVAANAATCSEDSSRCVLSATGAIWYRPQACMVTLRLMTLTRMRTV